jgi:formylglycine-generating enzyme required for sulfatase activity
MKIKIKKSVKYFLTIVFAGVITALGIDAADNAGGVSRSVLGKFFNSPSGPCPADMVLVEAEGGVLCLDRFESSAAESCPFADPASQGNTRENLNSIECAPISIAGRIPWRFISQDQAQEACAKAGKKLASNKEWQAGALGTPDKQSDWNGDDCQVAKNWNFQPGPAGSGKNCSSGAGAYDMIGNAWEWVREKAQDGKVGSEDSPERGYVAEMGSDGIPSKTDPQTPDENYYSDFFWIKKNGLRGVARGGYWGNNEQAGKYAAYIVSEPSFAGEGVGFRCSKSVR